MRRCHRPPAALAFALLATVCWLSSTTEAAALACGDVITEDTTLEHDLLDCPGDGLTIGADRVTLRLNGFMIEGGVEIFGRSRVTVLGPGVIRGFGGGGDPSPGVFIEGTLESTAYRNRVSKVTFIDNAGISAVLSDRALFDNNTIIINRNICTVGIDESRSFQNSIVNNTLHQGSIVASFETLSTVIRSNDIQGCDIFIADDDGFLVNDNSIFGVPDPDSAIFLLDASTRGKISNNRMDGTIGLYDEAVSRIQIYLNVVQGASVGIEIDGLNIFGNIVEANRLLNNDDQIRDRGDDTIIRNNFCDPPDDDPPCSTDFDPGEVVDSDVDSVLDRDDECPDTDFQAAVVINGIDTNLANVLTERSGCTMMDLILAAARAADDRDDFIGAVALLTRRWLDEDLIDAEDAGIIRTAAAGSQP